MNSWLIMKQSKVPAESDGKPEDELDNRDKAYSKAKTAKPSEAGDEVEPRHLGERSNSAKKDGSSSTSFL